MSIAVPSDQLNFGSIVEGVPWPDENEFPVGVVLTNPCDLEHDKADYIMIGGLRDARLLQQSSDFVDRVGGPPSATVLSKSKSDKVVKLIANYVHNIGIARYFFLDVSQIMDDPAYVLIDFQRIITVRNNDHGLTPIGIIPSPYSEKLISHYSAYVSRIGVDRVDAETLRTICQYIANSYTLDNNADYTV
jgi:hypothetical protein